MPYALQHKRKAGQREDFMAAAALLEQKIPAGRKWRFYENHGKRFGRGQREDP